MQSMQSKQVREYPKIEQIFGSRDRFNMPSVLASELVKPSVAGSLWVCARRGESMPPIDRGIPYSSVLLDGRRVGVWRHRSALVWDHGGLSFGLDATVMDDQMSSTGLHSVTSTKEFR